MMTANLNEDPPPPPLPDPAASSSALGNQGIYIKWDNRLWQEQPDGSYLVWDVTEHLWKVSDRQPPTEQGVIATKECPACGKRIKARFRTCPHCGNAFAEKTQPSARVAESPSRSKTQRKRTQLEVPPFVSLLVIAVMLTAAFFGYLRYRDLQACTRWNDAMDTVTQVAMQIEDITPGDTAAEQRIRAQNERLYGQRRPEGC